MNMGGKLHWLLSGLKVRLGLQSHAEAQRYELQYEEKWIRENFECIFQQIEAAKDKIYLWPGPNEFIESEKEWLEFVEFVRNRRCLEIGSGACGVMATWWWIEKRTIIDPLVLHYRALQHQLFGYSWFTDDMQLFPQCAEDFIPTLEHQIDGFVTIENCLDHCKNPWKVLENISNYCVPNCNLLLWTELWHARHERGHFNITKDVRIFEARLEALGFEIVHRTRKRKTNSVLEYGCRAIKGNLD